MEIWLDCVPFKVTTTSKWKCYMLLHVNVILKGKRSKFAPILSEIVQWDSLSCIFGPFIPLRIANCLVFARAIMWDSNVKLVVCPNSSRKEVQIYPSTFDYGLKSSSCWSSIRGQGLKWFFLTMGVILDQKFDRGKVARFRIAQGRFDPFPYFIFNAEENWDWIRIWTICMFNLCPWM